MHWTVYYNTSNGNGQSLKEIPVKKTLSTEQGTKIMAILYETRTTHSSKKP